MRTIPGLAGRKERRAMRIYRFRDTVAASWSPLFEAHNNSDAIREAQSIVQKAAGAPMGQHPYDFDLHCVGTDNTDEGTIAGGPSVKICNMGEVMGIEKPDYDVGSTEDQSILKAME